MTKANGEESELSSEEESDDGSATLLSISRSVGDSSISLATQQEDASVFTTLTDKSADDMVEDNMDIDTIDSDSLKRPRYPNNDLDFRERLEWYYRGDPKCTLEYIDFLLEHVEGIHLKLPEDNSAFPKQLIEALWAEGGETLESTRSYLFTVRAEVAARLLDASKTPESITDIVPVLDTATVPPGGVADEK